MRSLVQVSRKYLLIFSHFTLGVLCGDNSSGNSCSLCQVPLEGLKLEGKYLLEKEDPFHRHASILEPAYLLWENQEGVDDFWVFLETRRDALESLFPTIYNPLYHMTWLDTEKRKDYEAFFYNDEEGNLLVNTPSHSLADVKLLFVQCEGHLYVAEEILFQFHHSSLVGGDDVEIAGSLRIEKGVIKKISFFSGHYRPTYWHALQFVQDLLDKEIQLANFDVNFFMGGEKKKNMPIQHFLSYVPPGEISEEEQVTALLPIKELEKVHATKVKVFLTLNNEIYIGHKSWHQGSPEISSQGQIVASATAYLKDGKMLKIKFDQLKDSLLDAQKISYFVHILNENLNDLDQVSCIIKSNQKRKFPLSKLDSELGQSL